MNTQPEPTTGTSLVLVRPQPMLPANMREVKEMGELACEMLELDTDKNKGRMAGIILAGLEIGVPPMTAARGIDIIKGKPSLSAALKRALVQGSPVCHAFSVKTHRHKIIEQDGTERFEMAATCKSKRADNGQEHTVTVLLSQFEHLFVTRQGKKHEGWANYPGRMLIARASSRMCDEHYADVTYGMATHEVTTGPQGEVINVEPVEADAVPVESDAAGTAGTAEDDPDWNKAEKQATQQQAAAAAGRPAAAAAQTTDSADPTAPPWDGTNK
ncbi:MAG: hypothetical protein OXC11_00765 [Rhodospirillales bacterium]|nr:hypothetical protein [Rhodospirillales bacterium]